MNSEKTETLFKTYPDLLKKELLPDNFGCQDGWFILLDELAGRIQHYFDHCPESVKLEIVQINVKMGALRVHVRGGDGVVRKLIQEAEDNSKSICELDGKPASGLYGCAPSWYRYLCKSCADMHDCMTIEGTH